MFEPPLLFICFLALLLSQWNISVYVCASHICLFLLRSCPNRTSHGAFVLVGWFLFTSCKLYLQLLLNKYKKINTSPCLTFQSSPCSWVRLLSLNSSTTFFFLLLFPISSDSSDVGQTEECTPSSIPDLGGFLSLHQTKQLGKANHLCVMWTLWNSWWWCPNNSNHLGTHVE